MLAGREQCAKTGRTQGVNTLETPRKPRQFPPKRAQAGKKAISWRDCLQKFTQEGASATVQGSSDDSCNWLLKLMTTKRVRLVFYALAMLDLALATLYYGRLVAVR